jgi:Acyl-CoA dehydrogenase, C-terminal domain
LFICLWPTLNIGENLKHSIRWNAVLSEFATLWSTTHPGRALDALSTTIRAIDEFKGYVGGNRRDGQLHQDQDSFKHRRSRIGDTSAARSRGVCSEGVAGVSLFQYPLGGAASVLVVTFTNCKTDARRQLEEGANLFAAEASWDGEKREMTFLTPRWLRLAGVFALLQVSFGWFRQWSVHSAIEQLMFTAGSSAFSLTNPLQRYWRDLHVALRHVNNLPQLGYEIYGRDLVGVKPNVSPPGAYWAEHPAIPRSN